MHKTAKLIWAIVAGLVLVAIAYFYYAHDPASLPMAPKCPWLMLTHTECPGCGSQRAIHDLLHFRVADAFRHNLLIPIAIPYIVLGTIFHFWQGKHPFPRIEKVLYGRYAALVVLIIVVAYWVLRNIF